MSLAIPGGSAAPPEWQNVLKGRMMAQQVEDEVYKDIIGNCQYCMHLNKEVGEIRRSELTPQTGSWQRLRVI
jgi:hypothetical protein